MIAFPKKRIYGLIGGNRSGKDAVANFLMETRGFVAIAFADRIKEEFGISKEDFEAAKIAGNIEELRQRLWDFGAKAKEKDPLHFIRNVMNEAAKSEKSVIVTDIRTEDELNAFYEMNKCDGLLRRAYYVTRERPDFNQEILLGSQLKMSLIKNTLNSKTPDEFKIIENFENGIFYFNKKLEKMFVLDDLRDMLRANKDKDEVEKYICQFDVHQK